MRHALAKRKVRFFGFIAGLCIWLFAGGCMHLSEPSKTASGNALSEDLSRMESKNFELKRDLDSRDKMIQELEKDIADAKMQLLANEALINELQHRCDNQQQRLDAAIIEVVRTKSRLRSIESKAEAASTIAEAEIALNALKKSTESKDEGLLNEIAAADQLLKMSMDEFKTRNFGGALYLANQAKGQVRGVKMRQKSSVNTADLEGENSFSRPLYLKLSKNGNLRVGPGLHQKIFRILNKGTVVTGYSHKDTWVRIETADGVSGWLFYSLLGAR